MTTAMPKSFPVVVAPQREPVFSSLQHGWCCPDACAESDPEGTEDSRPRATRHCGVQHWSRSVSVRSQPTWVSCCRESTRRRGSLSKRRR